MKLFVLAASVGYVLGATADRDGACGALTLETDAVTCTDTADYCDKAQTAPAYCPTDATHDASAGTCLKDNADAFAAEPADTTGLCKQKIVDGQTCVADGDCATAGSTCRKDGCAASDAATKCGAALPAADGALGGCCDNDIASADAANFCLGAAGASGVVTVKVADGEACSVAGTGNTAGAKSSECASGTCTVTDATAAAGSAAADVGTCAATPAAAGTDGADCKPAVAACDANLTVDDGADTAVTTDDFCKGTQTALVSGNAAGADGGAPRTVVAGDDRCDGALVATITTGTDASCKCGAAETDDSPAAIFYGMSMVTAAVAYLL